MALIVAVNVVEDTASQSSWADIAIVVPWVNLAIIFAAVYAAALLATLAPSGPGVEGLPGRGTEVRVNGRRRAGRAGLAALAVRTFPSAGISEAADAR